MSLNGGNVMMMAKGLGGERFGQIRKLDPISLLGAGVALFLLTDEQPWWSVAGQSIDNLLSIQASPYYLHTVATGISPDAAFIGPLGALTRILLVGGFLGLLASGLRPRAWWRDIAAYFGLASILEVFVSFLLIYHAAETTMLAAYGTVPPFLGTTQLQGFVVGADLTGHFQPVVESAFNFSFYLGIACVALVFGSLLLLRGRMRTKSRGADALFSYQED